jgi:diacylglycerol kinase (ATP)
MQRPSTLMIVNPASGAGRTGRRWPGWEARLRAEGGKFDVEFTQEPGHASQLAKQAALDGYQTVVAVGGDGTLNETLNGLIENDQAVADVQLGLLPVGTGSDFARSINVPRHPLQAALHLLRAQPKLVDVGRIDCKRGHEKVTRYFINVAGLGFDGEVADRVNRAGRKGAGTLPYLSTLLVSLGTYHNKQVTITLDDRTFEGWMNSVVVCNARYFGGGMFIEPNARLDDGQLDVVILGDFNRLEVIANLPKIYRGTHLTHPKVSELRIRSMQVEAKERMFLQAEGELIGEAPVTFRVLPQILKVLT